MTLLTPSTYSSKQTTHSRCFPPYRLRHSARPAARFSSICSGEGEAMPSDLNELLPCGSSDIVRARGRDLVLIGRDAGKSGVVALACDEMDVVEPVLLGMVWYVRTGKRSTTDFGARHLRRRIRERSKRSA